MPPNHSHIILRDASVEDFHTIQSIYAHAVLTGSASFEEVPPSLDEMIQRREQVLSLDLPYLVAVKNNEVIGYSYATDYRSRSAYRHTIESSVYVANEHHGQGAGRALMSALIERCEQGRARQMIAVIGDSANAGSIALHKSLGFRLVGSLTGVGFKHGRWVDTVLMQRALGDSHITLPSE